MAHEARTVAFPNFGSMYRPASPTLQMQRDAPAVVFLTESEKDVGFIDKGMPLPRPHVTLPACQMRSQETPGP